MNRWAIYGGLLHLSNIDGMEGIKHSPWAMDDDLFTCIEIYGGKNPAMTSACFLAVPLETIIGHRWI